MWRKRLIVILLMVTAARSAGALDLYFGPQARYQRARGADTGNLMGGLSARLKFSPAFGMEASIDYRRKTFANGDGTELTLPVQATALFYPLPVLYGALGVGWYRSTLNYSRAINDAGIPDHTEQNYGWHFGGGLEIPFRDTVLLTGDIRYVYLNYDFQGLPRRDFTSDFFLFTFGALVRLF